MLQPLIWLHCLTDEKQNVSSAFCPAAAQTILEDEVDDPVYQVGPLAHRAADETLLTWMLL